MRLIFENIDEFKEWIRNHYQRGYEAYATGRGEVIVVPLKSTRPLLYGLIKPGDNFKDIISFLKSLGVTLYQVKSFDWTEEKVIGARMEVEEL